MMPRESTFRSKVSYSSHLPARSSFARKTLLIYDGLLENKNPLFKKWLKSFDLRYKVKAGEKLKSVGELSHHLRRLESFVPDLSRSEGEILVVGGGSVTDFGAFLASVLKRGLKLSLIPSTWLGALDSAHGGKTALNLNSAKNQIGTFYPAQRIFICKSLLFSQPAERAKEAYGEAVKMALLGPRKMLGNWEPSAQVLWKHLPSLIRQKWHWIVRDPYETKGIRQVLNLGHTLGHVFEAALELPHGIAVYWGLKFAIEWSVQTGFMAPKKSLLIQKSYFESLAGRAFGRIPQVKESQARRFLIRDKKSVNAQKLHFIFLAAIARPRVELVSVEELIREAKRQGFII